MKFTILLLVTLTTIGCILPRKHIVLSYRNPIAEVDRFRDSLIRSGTDTLISYGYAPAGGSHGLVANYYIYWLADGNAFITRFSSQTDFNIIKSQAFDLTYFGRYIDDAINEKQDMGNEEQSHYESHEYVFLKIGAKELKYGMVSYNKDKWMFSQRLLFIDKFRSFLFGIEGWQGLHYKTRVYHKD